MAVRRREAAGAVVHLDDSEGLARDIGQLLAEDLLHGLPFAGRGRLARRVRSEGEPRRDDQGPSVLSLRVALEKNAWLALLL